MASEVERAALEIDGVELAKAEGKENPITGMHVELTIQFLPDQEINKSDIKKFLRTKLPNHMQPKRIVVSSVKVGHRFKKA